MSVVSYLDARASNAVLSSAEKSSIATSISTLASRLDSYFTSPGDGLKAKFLFGSYTRATILPRAYDSQSDVDYMVVFEKGGFTPQTYLDRLKRFVEERYATSEIYQSNPTIVLELNHIKFDLVPALHEWDTNYKIPNGTSSWQSTNPNDFNSTLESANNAVDYKLKPAIRLAKIWNAANNYVFDSYSLEKWIAGLYFFPRNNARDLLFQVVDNLPTSTGTQWRDEKITRAKDIVKNVRDYENSEMPITAEAEVKRLIPE